MNKLWRLLPLLALAIAVQAQTTTTTATITDSNGITWANAAYTVNIVSSTQPVTNPGNATFTTSYAGAANSAGFFTLTLQRVANMSPANLSWQFCVTPAVSSTATYCVSVPVGSAGQSSQDVSTQINAVIQPPVIAGGAMARGYDDSEFTATPGNQYFNVITGAFRCYATTWLTCGGASTPLFTLNGFGDSYVLGSGALVTAIGGGFAQLAKTVPIVPSANNGVSGANSDAINLKVWLNVQQSPQVPSAYVIDGGANDGPNCGTSTACVTNFKEELNSSIGRTAIPPQERVMASTCTQTAGVWTADQAVYVLPAPTYYLNPGTALSATGSGAILTCTVPSRVASTRVGVNFQVANTQTGTFTVTVDGAAQTDQCSGTTTFTSGPCGGLTLLTSGQTTTAFRQEFTGTSGTSHTVVVTTTNAAKVNVTAIDAVTPTPQPNSNYVVAFGPNLAFTNSVLYDAAVGAVANQFAADGARVVFADIQSATAPGPGVNNTTDISQTATVNCDASQNANHPNDTCGYLHLAQTIANAAKSWNIFGLPAPFGGGTGFAMNGVALTTSAITSLSCPVLPGAAWTVPGITHLSHVSWGWAGDPGFTNLIIQCAATDSSTVVCRSCNPTAASITPTTQAINWWISQ